MLKHTDISSIDEETVRLYKKALGYDSNENVENLFSHLLKYPEVTNIEKLRKYWWLDKDKLQTISSSLETYISDLNDIVPVMIFRLFMYLELRNIDHENVPSYEKFINKNKDAVFEV